jgi:hypothetical protein
MVAIAPPHLLAARRFLLGALVAVGFLTAAGRAEAGVLVSGATGCEAQHMERPFLPWLDPAHYTLLPDGTFSHGARGWLRTGAKVVAENEPYYVHGDERRAALALPAGSSATSPSMCVGILHPTLRLLARNTGSASGALGVEVLFEDAAGIVHALTIGEIAGHPAWAPTVPMPVVANLLPLLPDNHTAVAFRFTPQGAGSSWVIDGVYVDPYRKS